MLAQKLFNHPSFCLYKKPLNLLKNSFFVAVLLLLTTTSYSQKRTASEGKKQMKQIVSESAPKEVNKKLFEFLEPQKGQDFVDEENYYSFLESVDSFSNEQQRYYPEVTFLVGKRLLLSKRYQESFPYLYKLELLITSGNTYEFECEFWEIMGLSYFFFKRYEQSKLALNRSLKCSKTTDLARINILNTLGLIYSHSEWKKSEEYYRKAIDIAQKTGNTAWYGVLSGNLGELYYKRQEYDLAKNSFEIDFSISVEAGEIESALSALHKLLEIDILRNNRDSAELKMNIIDSLANVHNQQTHISYFKAKSLWSEYTGDFSSALMYFKKAQHILDSLNVVRNVVNANNTEFQIDFEHRQAEVKILQEQSQTDKRIMGVLVILIVSITAGAFVSIQQILKRKKKEKEVLELKNKQVREDLERTEQEMQSILKSLMEKNETISRMSEELEVVFSQMDRTEEERKNLTDKLQAFTLLTDESWLKFKHLFEKLHPGFFDYFLSNYEDITNAEIRFAALLKLNLENLEISKALGIGLESVRKTNLRLRKRLDIAEQKDLLKLIQSIG